MRPQSLLVSVIAIVVTTTIAHALTLDEIRARLEAAGYSQVREAPSGKIKTFKAVKDGHERLVIVDSFGHIKELQ
jgi:hypothetical protein